MDLDRSLHYGDRPPQHVDAADSQGDELADAHAGLGGEQDESLVAVWHSVGECVDLVAVSLRGGGAWTGGSLIPRHGVRPMTSLVTPELRIARSTA